MKRGVFLSALGAVVFAISASGAVIYNPTNLAEALNYAKTGDTVKLKAGTIPVTATLKIEKGITLSGGWSDETTRAEGAVTVLHGGDSVEHIVKVGAVKAEGSVTVENLCFTRAWRRGLYQCNSDHSPKDSCDLVVRNCQFLENGLTSNANNSHGMGAQFAGTDSSVTVSDCVFAGNLIASTNCIATSDNPRGGGIYANGLSSLIVEDSDFITNGVPFSVGGKGYDKATPCFNGLRGAGIAANGTPTQISGCRFIGNMDRLGATVMIYNASGGSSISNCLFCANHHNEVASWNCTDVGTINVNLANASDTVTISGCTIAYNPSDVYRTSAGLAVQKGTVSVRDTIIFCNERATKSSTVGSEIMTGDDGTVNISYSLVTGSSDAYCTGNIVFGDGVIYGDPLFATDCDTVTNSIFISNSRAYFDPSKVTQAETLAYDLHLKSKGGYYLNDGTLVAGGSEQSPAIDAGDPDSEYSNEPSPNGKCVNLGFYGNTQWASKSPTSCFIVIVR